jgi:phosphoribosyl 1,2-cyclic phosphodiesterase
MQARIWGARGSYPVARADVLAFGGNTSAVEVRVGQTTILLDAGTGLRALGRELCQDPERDLRRLHLFISHTHWDHIMGFPFFAPLFDQQARLRIYGLRREGSSLRQTFADAMGGPLLPFSLSDVQARLSFEELNDSAAVEIDGVVTVRAMRVNHPYRALGYRVESAQGVLAYIPDTGPFHTVLFGDTHVSWQGRPCGPGEQRQLEAMRAGVLRLIGGADWLLYDAQFTDEEYRLRPHWGHSTPAQAIEIAAAADVRRLLLFHHDPHRTDAQVRALLEHHRPLARFHGLQLDAAREGMRLTGGRAA